MHCAVSIGERSSLLQPQLSSLSISKSRSNLPLDRMQFNKQDWFLCHGFSTGDVSSMSNSQFREELIFQIRKQVLLQNPQELKGAPDDSFLRSIDVRIDDRRLGEFRSFCSERMPMETQIKGGESATSPSQPVFLTFHGTSNPSALNSIVEHGFLMPGQQHPRYGYSLNMRVGNLYGDGVYSSSKLHIAASYAAMADDSTVQLIVSIVAPGRVHYVGHAPFHGLPPYPHSSGSKCAWTRRDGMLTPGCESGTYPYAEDANTLTPDFSTMWICGDSRQMCPVAVVTLLQLPFQSVESWTSRQMLHAKETAALSQPQSARFDIQLTHLCEDFPRSHKESCLSAELRYSKERSVRQIVCLCLFPFHEEVRCRNGSSQRLRCSGSGSLIRNVRFCGSSVESL